MIDRFFYKDKPLQEISPELSQLIESLHKGADCILDIATVDKPNLDVENKPEAETIEQFLKRDLIHMLTLNYILSNDDPYDHPQKDDAEYNELRFR